MRRLQSGELVLMMRKVVVALLLATSLPVRALASADLPVFAAPGPSGMTVRWQPAHTNEPLTATVVRVAPDSSRVTLPPVARPNDGVSETFNATVDRKNQGAIASLGAIAVALVRGDAVIDSGVRTGVRYRYEVTLSDGESGASNLTPPAGAKPRADKMAIVRVAAVGEDRSIRLTVTPQQHGGLLRISRGSGGPFEVVATAVCQGRGDTVYVDRVTPGPRYAYRVAWVDIFGNVGPDSEPAMAIAKDLHHAMPVTGVRATTRGSILTLTWNASTDSAVVSYDVLRGSSTTRLAQIGTIPAPRTTFTDRVTPGSILRYDVRARTRAGVEGMPSVGVSLLVPKTTPPDAPADLVAHSQRGSVELSWSPSHDQTVNAYEVYRRTKDSVPTLLAQVTSPAHSFGVDLPQESIASYEYGVGASDRFGNRTMPASWVTARALRSTIPLAPAPLRVRFKSPVVILDLAPLVDPDVAALAVYKGDDAGGLTAIAKISPLAISFTDRAVTPGHRYAYALAAISREGSVGARSAAMSIRLLPAQLRSPALSAKLLSDGFTVELHWPETSDIVGYMIVRRAPDGTMTTVAPLVRAFTYRDVLPLGAHGSFAYAASIVTRAGPQQVGPFTSVTVH